MKILLIEMKSCLFIKYIKNSAKVSSSLMLYVPLNICLFVCLFKLVLTFLCMFVDCGKFIKKIQQSVWECLHKDFCLQQ